MSVDEVDLARAWLYTVDVTRNYRSLCVSLLTGPREVEWPFKLRAESALVSAHNITTSSGVVWSHTQSVYERLCRACRTFHVELQRWVGLV